MGHPAYAALLNKLIDHKFADTTTAPAAEHLAFYEPPAVPIFDHKKPEQRTKTLRSIEELRLLQLEKTAARLPVPAP